MVQTNQRTCPFIILTSKGSIFFPISFDRRETASSKSLIFIPVVFISPTYLYTVP